MVSVLSNRRGGPVGIDIGSRSVKLLQLNSDRSRVIDAARQELSWTGSTDKPKNTDGFADPRRQAAIAEAIAAARQGRNFRGREAVVCLGVRDLFVQSVRIPKAPPEDFRRLVMQEASNRLPYPIAEAEVRFLEAADVRHGDSVKTEVILLACHRAALDGLLEAVQASGLKPVAVDVEPLALMRCYGWQFRREEDKHQRAMFLHVGAASTTVVIARNSEPLIVKYLDIAGRHMDQALAAHLKMDLSAAAALRRHNGDRRAGQQDPEVARSVQEAIRPVVERIAGELAMCVRYHSVTFRGQPLARVVIGGGEAAPLLAEELSTRLNLPCELGDPLRSFELAIQTGRRGQWDLAVGMALRQRATATV
jgi:type IV pilus assembly protein PilM